MGSIAPRSGSCSRKCCRTVAAKKGHGRSVGQNHTNSISFRGGPAGGGGFRDSLRTGTGTGMSSDMVYPPGQNHKMGKRLQSTHAACKALAFILSMI